MPPNQDQHPIQPQQLMSRSEEKIGDAVISHGKTEPGLHPQDPAMQRAAFQHGHKEPPAPSPPRAIASLSVRVLGQPDRQGLPPVTPRTHEKDGAAPSEPGSAHAVLHLSRSAGLPAAGRAKEDSDDDDSVDNESEDDEDWGPGPAGPQRGNKAHPQPQMPLGVPSTFARSKRKLQPPQHIPPPPQPHHSPMQLRHPTPPPSPPSGLFPLPDTPKQSPPDTGDSENEGPEAQGQRMVPFSPTAMQRQDSNSSSRSSSPEPPVKRGPGPLSLLVHKMESEKASRQSEIPSAMDLSGEMVNPDAGPSSSSKSTQRKMEREGPQDGQDVAEERPLKEGRDEEQEQEKKHQEEEKERERKNLEEVKLRQKEEQEREYQEEKKDRQAEKVQKFPQGKKKASESQETDSSSDSDSKSDSSSHSSQTSSSSSGNKTHPARHLKVSVQTDRGNNNALKIYFWIVLNYVKLDLRKKLLFCPVFKYDSPIHLRFYENGRAKFLLCSFFYYYFNVWI